MPEESSRAPGSKRHTGRLHYAVSALVGLILAVLLGLFARNFWAALGSPDGELHLPLWRLLTAAILISLTAVGCLVLSTVAVIRLVAGRQRIEQEAAVRRARGLDRHFAEGLVLQLLLFVLASLVMDGGAFARLILVTFALWNVGLVLVRGAHGYTMRQVDRGLVLLGPIVLFVALCVVLSTRL